MPGIPVARERRTVLVGISVLTILSLVIWGLTIPAKGPDVIGPTELEMTFPEHGGSNTSFFIEVQTPSVVLKASLDIEVEEVIYTPVSKNLTTADQSGNVKAWKGYGDSNTTNRTPSTLKDIAIDPKGYINISSSNDSYWRMDTAPPWDLDTSSQPIPEVPYHLFEFNLSDANNKLDILEVHWEGHGFVNEGISPMNCSASMYIWYDLTSSWILSGNYSDLCSGMVDKDLDVLFNFMGMGGIETPKFLHLLVIGEWDPDGLQVSLATDLVYLNTTTHTRTYPHDLQIDVDNDGEIEHIYEGYINETCTFGTGEGFVTSLQAIINRTGGDSIKSGPFMIPINFTSSTGGRIKVSLMELELDLQPTLEQDLPDKEMFEDGELLGAFDLRDHFNDDLGVENLTFGVEWEERPDKVHAEISDGHLVNIMTVAQNWSGAARFRFSATDRFDQTIESENITIMVKPVNDPPFLDAIGNITVYERQSFSFYVTASDADADDVLTFSDDTSLFDIDELTGLIEFTPRAEDIGDLMVNISVKDTNGTVDHEIITVTVKNVNDPPTVTLYLPTDEFVLTVNKVKLIWIGVDPDGDELTYDLYIDSGSGLELEANGLTGPEYDLSGLVNGTTYKWSVEASDGELRSERPGAFMFKVEEEGGAQPNQPPTVTLFSPSKDSILGTLYPTLTWRGYDPDGDVLTYHVTIIDMEGGIVQQDTVSLTYLKLSEPLTNNMTYIWTVVPYDGSDYGICVSGKWSFSVNRTGHQESSAPIVDVTIDPTGTIEIGDPMTFDASGAHDPDGVIVLYIWTFGDGTTLTGPEHQMVEHSYEAGGEYDVSLVIFDNDGRTNIWTHTVKVRAEVKDDEPGIIGLSMEQFMVALIIISILVAIVSVTGHMAYRRIRYEKYEVEQVFLIYRDGRLIRHVSTSKDKAIIGEDEEPDGEIMSSMLTAVQDFIKDTLKDRKSGSSLKVLEYGDKKIVLEKGKRIFLTVFITGNVTDEIRGKMKRAIERIETDNKKVLRKWDGNLNGLWGVGPALNRIVDEEFDSDSE